MSLLRLTVAAFLAAGVVAGTASTAKPHRRNNAVLPCDSVTSIGVAHMEGNGIIVLRIRSLPRGPIAEGELHYAPSDRQYQAIKRHLGGILPGKYKSVPPWC